VSLPEVEHDAEMDTWVAFSEQTCVIGYGDSRDAAMADYLDNCRESLDVLTRLGNTHVAARLWATLPALREAVGLT
jgi:hypothetical protein